MRLASQAVGQQHSRHNEGAPYSGSITLSSEFYKDMVWLNSFNGQVYSNKHLRSPFANLYVDASLTGVGGF